MSDIYNPKFRIKFLRTATIDRMGMEPGNFMVDMDTGKVFIDILASDNQPRRITLAGANLDNYYTKSYCDTNFVTEAHMRSLISQLNDAANS